MPKDTKPRQPARIQLPHHPVDALEYLAKLGIVPPLDKKALAQARALCDEQVPLNVPAAAAAKPVAYTVAQFAAWGAEGGAASTPAKVAAAAANGRKGGRPKGSKDRAPRTRRR